MDRSSRCTYIDYPKRFENQRNKEFHCIRMYCASPRYATRVFYSVSFNLWTHPSYFPSLSSPPRQDRIFGATRNGAPLKFSRSREQKEVTGRQIGTVEGLVDRRHSGTLSVIPRMATGNQLVFLLSSKILRHPTRYIHYP